MVFCGKPSRACGRCRERRLKCDKGAPFCSACLRAGAESCEYRDRLNLTFRDQNDKVMRKFKQEKAKKRLDASCPNGPIVPAYGTSSSSPCQALTLPTWQLARGYMYTNYMACGYLPCIVSLAGRWPDSALQSAITAVGLAALANISQSRQVMEEARQECTAAMSMVGSMLSDPVACRRDDVLAAVVMLSMFEVMTCTDASSIRRWMGHVDGAARIIEVRGEEQLDRSEGLELFRHLRVGICLSGIYRQSPSSVVLDHLTQKAKRCGSPESQTADDLAGVVFRISDFCARLKQGTLSNPSEIVREALRLDADVVAAAVDVPSTSSYTVAHNPDMSENSNNSKRSICGDTYHVYASLSTSAMWSNCRSTRLFLREVLINALKAAGDEDDGCQHRQTLMDESRLIGQRLVEDVCASVPCHIDPSLHLVEVSANITQDLPPSNATNQPPHSSGGGTLGTGGAITLLWPLLIAANSGFASADQREWIVGCLDKIGRGMGIGQAKAMAQLLRDGRKTTAWLTAGDEVEVAGF